MNPLTLSYVRKHRLDPEVFREAARLYAARFEDPGCDYPGGCCIAIRCALQVRRRFLSGDELGQLTRSARPYSNILFAAMADGANDGLLYLWPCPRESILERDANLTLTPRLIALELAALFVEDLLAGAVAAGHNPDKLTNAQVGKGWRVLARKEIHNRPYTSHIQSWGPNTRVWFGDGWKGASKECTYRTRKPAGYFLTR